MSVEAITHRPRTSSQVEIAVVHAAALSDNDIANWRSIQDSNPALVSPYLTLEFTQLVATVRDDVFVAVLQQQGETIGYFPYQRGAMRIGKPVGGVMSDYQGVIVADSLPCDPATLVRACGLRAWDFDHLIAAQSEFAPFHRIQTCSPIMDLSHGYEAYLAERRASGGDKISDLQRLERKLERDHGTLRFVPHETDPRMLDTLIEWKTSQFIRTGVPNIFRESWIRNYVRRLHGTDTPGFGGVFSVLYASGRPVAMSLDLRSRSVRHGSITAFDLEFFRYSPGMLLLLMSAQHAASVGLQTFDLGKGDMPYKQQLASAAVPMCEGSVECSASLALVRRVRDTAAGAVRRSPLRPPARFIKKCFKQATSLFHRA